MALPVRGRHQGAVYFVDPIWAPWVKRGGFRLGNIHRYSVDLAAGSLEEPGLRGDLPDRLQDPENADGKHRRAQDRLLERISPERIGGEVVHLVGLVIPEELLDAFLVEQVVPAHF